MNKTKRTAKTNRSGKTITSISVISLGIALIVCTGLIVTVSVADTTPPVIVELAKIPATINIDPDTLNLKSQAKWITCHIGLPEGYDVADIDVTTILLEDAIPAEPHPTEIGDYDDDGIADLMVKFDRAAVQEILEGGDEVEIIVAGELTDGTPFEGSDMIRVIDKCKEINFDLSMEFLGSEGTTIADERGLTFNIDGVTWTQDEIIYDEQYWGTYPLYRPGSFIVVRLTITNKGKEPEAGFDIECTAFQMNTDGSNGASIMTTPQTRNIRVANGETKTIDIIFPLPLQAKNLNKCIVSIYTEGTLLMTKEGIFCPPEELKYCEELVVPATIDIDPNTLNPKSKGNWVTAYIELPEGYDVSSIDVGTVMLNDLVPAEPHPTEIGDYDDDGIADLMVKFDRAAVQEILEGGDEVEIIVAGELTDGTPFEGSDTISVIDKCKEINFDLSMEFSGPVGTTIAHANGLTFFCDDPDKCPFPTWSQDGIIYNKKYWGEYPLYLPGHMMGVIVTITNKGKEPEAGFDIECTAFQMNTDGSNGASIMTPQTRNIRVANGETKTEDIVFQLPDGAKNLNRFIVSIYTEGTLLMTKEGIFCPPEELK